MDASRLMTMTATLRRRTDGPTRDDRGDLLPFVTTTTTRCYLWQTARSAETANETTGNETWQIAVPAAAADALRLATEVVVGDVTYFTDGPPWQATNARTGVVEHVEATLRRSA